MTITGAATREGATLPGDQGPCVLILMCWVLGVKKAIHEHPLEQIGIERIIIERIEFGRLDESFTEAHFPLPFTIIGEFGSGTFLSHEAHNNRPREPCQKGGGMEETDNCTSVQEKPPSGRRTAEWPNRFPILHARLIPGRTSGNVLGHRPLVRPLTRILHDPQMPNAHSPPAIPPGGREGSAKSGRRTMTCATRWPEKGDSARPLTHARPDWAWGSTPSRRRRHGTHPADCWSVRRT